MERRKSHKLSDIHFIAVTAAICGADKREGMEEFAVTIYHWLKKAV